MNNVNGERKMGKFSLSSERDEVIWGKIHESNTPYYKNTENFNISVFISISSFVAILFLHETLNIFLLVAIFLGVASIFFAKFFYYSNEFYILGVLFDESGVEIFIRYFRDRKELVVFEKVRFKWSQISKLEVIEINGIEEPDSVHIDIRLASPFTIPNSTDRIFVISCGEVDKKDVYEVFTTINALKDRSSNMHA